MKTTKRIKTPVMNADTAADRLDKVQKSLRLVCGFLRRYSPLLNAHNNDFLTHNVWELLPDNLARDLELVEDWHDLPRKCLSIRERFVNDADYQKQYFETLENELLPAVDSGCFVERAFSKQTECAWYVRHTESIDSFLTVAVACTLDSLQAITPTLSIISEDGQGSSSENPFISHAMGIKKSHEIEHLSTLVSQMCREYNTSRVIDVGSGKGYLGSYINLTYGIEVLELDSVDSNVRGSIQRRSRLEEKWDHLRKRAGYSANLQPQASQSKTKDGGGHVVSMTAFIENGSHLEAILNESSSSEEERSCLLAGLHTCGSLAYSAIDTFVTCQSTRVLLNVGCCYNLFDEGFAVDKFSKNKTTANSHLFPMSSFLKSDNDPYPICLGRNARIIAAQSVDRLAVDEEGIHEHMFFRVVLQQFLKEKLGVTSSDWIVGKLKRGIKNQDFALYARKALQNLKLEHLCDELSDDDLRSYIQQWSDWEKRLHLFYMLRCCLGPVIETCILLDRLCFLLEKSVAFGGPVVEAHLLKVFDPQKSPRCFAVFAAKDAKTPRESKLCD